LLCKECSVMEQMKPTFRDLVEWYFWQEMYRWPYPESKSEVQ
jgi:hypothetical protein